MDVERAIEHLLDLHAKAEVRFERFEARHAKAETRLEKLEKDVSALVKAFRGGAKALFKLQERNGREIKALGVETDRRIRALAEEQLKTQAGLQRLERALLRPGGNGRPRR